MTEVPVAPTLSSVSNVEIAQTGTWKISTGTVTLTSGDLHNAVAAMDCPAVRRPVLKLGHVDPRFDGEPAVGFVDNMGVDDTGVTLAGDFVGMPGWLAPVLPSAYPDRSMEAQFDFMCQLGHQHPFVITAVALLGVTPPGIGTLESLQDVAGLYGLAASADADRGFSVTIHAKGDHPMPNPHPREVAAGVTVEDVRRAYYDTAPYSAWISSIELDPLQLIVTDDASGDITRVPVTISGTEAQFGDAVTVEVQYVDKKAAASANILYASREESRAEIKPPRQVEPELPPAKAIDRVHQAAQKADEQKGAGMPHDPAKIREALGLAASASDEEVTAELAKVFPAAAPPPAADPPPAPAPVAAGAPLPEGAIVIDSSVVKRLQEDAQQGVAAMAEIQKNRRDTVIKAAIEAGKFPPARKEHYELMWAGDPEGTEQHISRLAAGLVPLNAAGYPGTESFEDDARYYGLYPEEAPSRG